MIELRIHDGEQQRLVSCDAVLFDMDGTLVDSTACVEKVWRDWAVGRGLDPDVVMQVAHGRQNPAVIQMVAPHLDVTVEEAFMMEADEACRDGIVAVPGAPELLTALPNQCWAIVTSAWRRLAEIRLNLVGLPIPPVMLTADDVSHGKPHPDGYLRAAQMLGVEPSRCLVIEDSHAGIEAGRAAGMMVVAIATTFRRDELHPAWCIDDLRAVSLLSC